MIHSDILQKYAKRLTADGHFWLGFSGGMDSTVLLALLANSMLRPVLRVVHVHHNLSERADQWAEHCERVCNTLNVPIVVRRTDICMTGKGLEEAARQARYKQFQNVMRAGDILATAHHADDQAETFIYRLARGAGLKGLGGISDERSLAHGTIVRPLLSVTRQQLLNYAEEKRLQWVHDDSNANEKFDRNYIRHSIIPQLSQRWPSFIERVSSTTGILREQQVLLNTYLNEDLTRCGHRIERLGESICIEPMLRFSHERQHAIIRYWIESKGYTLPSVKQLAKVDEVVNAKVDAKPKLAIGLYVIQRYRSRLYLCPKVPHRIDLEESSVEWDGSTRLELRGGFVLTGQERYPVRERTRFTIRFKKTGLRCKPSGRAYSQTVKKLLQEYRLEPWLRDCIPLIYYKDTLIAVGDLFYCDDSAKSLLGSIEWKCIV